MRAKNSLIVPVVAILSGVLLLLKSFGVFGNVLPNDILTKLWPVLLAAVALDLLLAQRRLIGAVIMGFFAAVLLCTQFTDAGWNHELWGIFLKCWPILLILFGVDCIFAERSLINGAVIAAGIVVLVYILLTVLDIPAIKKLPVSLPSLSEIIPTSSFSGTVPSRPGQQQGDFPAPGGSGPAGQPLPQQYVEPVVIGQGGQVSIPMPEHNAVQLNISALSGKVSVKKGAAAGQFLTGNISLDRKEKLSYAFSLNNPVAIYNLNSEGSYTAPNQSVWDLSLSGQRQTGLNVFMETGYFKADLRGLDLSAVSIENKYGPIDIMTPQTAGAHIKITAGDGDIRVYVPNGGRIECTVVGTDQVEYPQRNYYYSGNMLTPRSSMQTPVSMEIHSRGGRVQIIESN